MGRIHYYENIAGLEFAIKQLRMAMRWAALNAAAGLKVLRSDWPNIKYYNLPSDGYDCYCMIGLYLSAARHLRDQANALQDQLNKL